jgi:hypothetical protein
LGISRKKIAMKKLYIILYLLLLSNYTFGETKEECNYKTEFKAGPGLNLLKYLFLPITSFLPIWGSYDEGSHTNENIPLLNFDRTMDVNAVRQRLIDRIKKLTFK